MSEYWVSKKRYFCKYCDVYIADDVPSRQHHENGLRHKGNVDRFVRGLYKAGEKRKKDADEEKREIRRIEQAAHASFAQDVGAGRAQYPSSSSSSSPAVASSHQKPRKSGGISDYSTPESLGYQDPDIERAHAEAERRRTQGVVGNWEVVESTPMDAPGEESIQHVDHMPNTFAEEDRGRLPVVGLGEIYDPGIITIKPKIKLEGTVNQAKEGASTADDAKATALFKWAPVKWKRAGEATDDTDVAVSSGPGGDAMLTEGAQQVPADPLNADDSSASTPVADTSLKEEPAAVKSVEATPPSGETASSSSASLFRKRKAPIGGGASNRGRGILNRTTGLLSRT
ncbi:hypothetical protein F5148DRAFT_1262104 [Russula earlei]|uniref:Uncharacterized protein n=1 Tax=Russula earlei TaxID=71964 RepID=A0ACC0TT02_9AGAM|nr:hypothetical protein F5148DRAFT_1262104 [Russula earlei]